MKGAKIVLFVRVSVGKKKRNKIWKWGQIAKKNRFPVSFLFRRDPIWNSFWSFSEKVWARKERAKAVMSEIESRFKRANKIGEIHFYSVFALWVKMQVSVSRNAETNEFSEFFGDVRVLFKKAGNLWV